MIWQDALLAVCSIVFTIALIPSILGNNKPEVYTSTLTALVLLVMAICYISLSLWFAVFAALFNCFAWVTLALQKSRQSRTIDYTK